MISYWQTFRLIFVIFSLYLMGDAFYRWDGFRYHSSFSEFLPSAALAAILWNVLSILLSLAIWLFLTILEWSLQLRKRRLRSEHILIFLAVAVTFGIIFWTAKRFIFDHTGSSQFLKFKVILYMIFASLFLTWLLRNKFNVIQERITPLVWLFGSFIIISVPLAAYNAWWIQTDDIAPQKIFRHLSAHSDRPNIILITFDALTAEDMSLYGYERLTTPFISEWSKGATVFTRAEASCTWTTPAIASLMLGKRGWTHQFYHPGGAYPLKSDIENLPLLLQNNGYTTMAFVQNDKNASPKILGVAKNFHFSPIESELRKSATIVDRIDGLLYKLFFKGIKMYDWILKGDFILRTLLGAFFSYNETVIAFQPEIAFKSFLNVIDQEAQEPFFAWFH